MPRSGVEKGGLPGKNRDEELAEDSPLPNEWARYIVPLHKRKADPSPPFASTLRARLPRAGATGFGMTTGREAEASFGAEKAAASRRTPKEKSTDLKVGHYKNKDAGRKAAARRLCGCG